MSVQLIQYGAPHWCDMAEIIFEMFLWLHYSGQGHHVITSVSLWWQTGSQSMHMATAVQVENNTGSSYIAICLKRESSYDTII